MVDPKAPTTPVKASDSDEVVIPRQLDGLETAIAKGKVVDQNFERVNVPDIQAQPKAENLDTKEQISASGELKPGDIGWIELDDKGSPVGAATKFPKKNVPQAPVATIVENTPTVLATPAGAFLTSINMQPSPAAYKYQSSAYGRDYQAAEDARRKWKGLPTLSEVGLNVGATKQNAPSKAPSSKVA